MPKWKKGESGNPDGRALTSALRQRLLAPAFDENGNEILEEDASGKRKLVKKLHQVADALIKKAIAGDTTAIEQCFNRLDGKVPNVNVEVPVKGAEEMTRDELIAFLAGTADDRGAEDDSSLSRAKPAGSA